MADKSCENKYPKYCYNNPPCLCRPNECSEHCEAKPTPEPDTQELVEVWIDCQYYREDKGIDKTDYYCNNTSGGCDLLPQNCKGLRMSKLAPTQSPELIKWAYNYVIENTLPCKGESEPGECPHCKELGEQTNCMTLIAKTINLNQTKN